MIDDPHPKVGCTLLTGWLQEEEEEIRHRVDDRPDPSP